MTNPELNLSSHLDAAYGRTMDALYYANLLARHARDAMTNLSPEPGKPSFVLDFRTSNSDIPPLARTQFGIEVARYGLILALAHFDRFVLDLAVLDGLVSALVASHGQLAVADAMAFESRVRTVRKNQSVAEELHKLAGATNANVASGMVWFRGLYAIRNCLVHRGGIVGVQDKRLLEGVRWRRLALTLNGGELRGEPPLLIEEGGEIGVKLDDSSRSWSEGEGIVLSLEELQQMLYSLFQLAALLVQHLNVDFAGRLGLPLPTGPNLPTT